MKDFPGAEIGEKMLLTRLPFKICDYFSRNAMSTMDKGRFPH